LQHRQYLRGEKEKMNELNREQIKEIWGEEFLGLVNDKKIKITESAITVELSKSVKTIENGETKLLEIKEPSVSDLRAMDLVKGEMAKSVVLMGACAGLAEATINNLKTRDYMRVQKVISCFLDVSQQTGDK
jgi:hypothetical protein